MKLGNFVVSTIQPLKKPIPMATANEIGTASHSDNPAPPNSPISFDSRMTSIPIAPVLAPDDRSNSPPTINIETATAMIPSVDALSMMFEAPLAVPNGTLTAQKKIQIPIAPIMAPISGRMKRRWNTPR